MSEVEIRRSVEVQRPPAEVFRRVSDVPSWPDLSPSFRDAEQFLGEGNRCLTGFTSRHDGRSYGMVTYREFEPSRRMSFEHLNPSSFFRRHYGEWTFEPSKVGTCVTLVHRIVPRFLPGFLLDFALQRVMLGPHSSKMLNQMCRSIEAEEPSHEEEKA